MTIGGWITMVLSVGFVTGLFGWCIWRVMTLPGAAEHVHGEPFIDTGDTED